MQGGLLAWFKDRTLFLNVSFLGKITFEYEPKLIFSNCLKRGKFTKRGRLQMEQGRGKEKKGIKRA